MKGDDDAKNVATLIAEEVPVTVCKNVNLGVLRDYVVHIPCLVACSYIKDFVMGEGDDPDQRVRDLS